MPSYATTFKPYTFYSVSITVSASATVSITYGNQVVASNLSVPSGTTTLTSLFKTKLQSQTLTTTITGATGSVVFNEVLVDPFVIDDYQEKVLTWNEKQNLWHSDIRCYAEQYARVANTLISFSGGLLYMHPNSEGSGADIAQSAASLYNNFFGQQFTAWIVKIINPAVPLVKYIQSIAVESNLVPSYMYLRTVYANGYTGVSGEYITQGTDLTNVDFVWKDGVWYAPFFRDRLTPGQTSYNQALYTGDKMRAQWGYLYFEIDQNSSNLVLNAVNIGWIADTGSKTT